MPLPADERIVALSQQLLRQFDAIFGLNPGFRPAHAKGTMLTGTFTPSPEASSLTKAPHMSRQSTPVTVRFSDSTGIPLVPDNDPNANPRGFAIRFNLAEHVHTDIVSHSTDGFPTRTGQEFLELLTALATATLRIWRVLRSRRFSVRIRRRWRLCRLRSLRLRASRARATLA